MYKTLLQILACVCLIVVLSMGGLWFMPVKWVWPLVTSRYPDISALAVSGSVHHGKLTHLGVQNVPVGNVSWRLLPTSLWRGLAVHFAVDGDDGQAHGQLTWVHYRYPLLSDGDVSLPLKLAIPGNCKMSVQGHIKAQVDAWRLDDVWPRQLQAQMRLVDGQLFVEDEHTKLDTINMRVQSRPGNVLHVDMHSEHGQAHQAIHGELMASPLGWRLQMEADKGDNVTLTTSTLASCLSAQRLDGHVLMHAHGGFHLN